MIKRRTTFYVNKLKPIDFCGKTVMWQMDLNGAYETPFKTEPTTGEHDFNTCEDCQNTRKELIKRLTEKFNGTEQNQGFPFCCSHHPNLTKVKEFNRASFVPVPEMVADKIIYTNQHITNNHENENYYKDITDYIDYTVESFGQMPNSCGEPLYLSDYFFYVTDLLTRNTEISKERKNRLLEFLEAHQTPPTKNKNTDLNILLGTYQKWLKTFPFDISFFSKLKPHFEKQLPILNGKPETNKYTGFAKAKMHTKGSLIDVLLNLTKNLLDKVNIPELRKQGAITDIQANQLEFAEAELNTKTAEITKQYSKGELKYVKALKKWLQLHKDYFKEVAPLLKALPPQQTEQPKPETKETELSERIKKHFGFFNKSCPRKHKQILNDTDFKRLIDWTIWYFENDFKVPEILEPIKVVNTNKTFVQLAFKYLFKELHKSSPYPETLFEFYQSAFTPYSEDKKRNFEAVKNNDEVKKLMQIDY